MNGDLVILTAWAPDELSEQEIESVRTLLRAHKFEQITIQRKTARFVFEAIFKWWQRLPP